MEQNSLDLEELGEKAWWLPLFRRSAPAHKAAAPICSTMAGGAFAVAPHNGKTESPGNGAATA